MDTRRGNGTDDRAPETLRKGLGQIRTKGRGKDAKGPGRYRKWAGWLGYGRRVESATNSMREVSPPCEDAGKTAIGSTSS